MGALAAAACAWSARGDPGYAGKWAGSSRATQLGATGGAPCASNRGYLNGRVRQLGGFFNGRCMLTVGFLTLRFKPQLREARYNEKTDLRITAPNMAIRCDTKNEEALVHRGTFSKTLKASL